jgi:hypothetical protein
MNDFARRLVTDRRYTKLQNPSMPPYDMRYNHDMAQEREHMHQSQYDDDGRRGVKGTGRYGIGGSMYRGDRYSDYRDYGRDYTERDNRDYADYRDYGASEDISLTHQELKRWADKLRNADGTDGAHFTKEDVRKTAERVGVRYDHFSEADLCMATNMLYSDFSEVLRPLIPSDKEAMIYVKMGKAFLEDKDAPKGSEKLAMYYFCIVDDENAR